MVGSPGKNNRKSKPNVEPPTRQGTFMFPNGDKYDGQYKQIDGVILRSGQGEHIASNGTVYKGEWDHDKMNGNGTLTHPNGSMYEGEFVDNSMHGHGKYTWPDGSKYEGPFYQNRMEGYGKFIDNKNQGWTGQFSQKTANDLRFALNM